MVEWVLQYTMQSPSFGPNHQELYATALEQCTGADGVGCPEVMLSEHHASADGYLPSPLIMAAAVAARTSRLRLLIAALVLPFHDPIRIAEDVLVLDQLSAGRIGVVVVAGYVPDEFAMFRVDRARRTDLMTEKLRILDRALRGEPFERDGVTVHVTPGPVQRSRPPLLLGGSTEIGATRAAELADGFMAAMPDPRLRDVYADACRARSRREGRFLSARLPLFVHVADDPDAVWAEIAPHALHEANLYARWASTLPGANPYQPIDDADSLRDQGLYAVLTPDECVQMANARGPGDRVILHPLMGGMSPQVSWEGLELFASAVLPRLT